MDDLMFALLITFTICFVIGFGGCYFKTQNQSILEETERIIRRTNDLSMTYINDYYESNKLRMDEIEKTLLAEIACLATKNNNDIKEIKDKITTGKKSKRISQLIDENNKLKEENKKIKKENFRLNKENDDFKKRINHIIQFYPVPIYNPYIGVINLCNDRDMYCSSNRLNRNNNYEW